jgi:hypothetical protein
VFKYLFPLLLVLMFGYACNNSNNELQTTEKEAFDPYSEIMNKADLLISKDTVEGGNDWVLLGERVFDLQTI